MANRKRYTKEQLEKKIDDCCEWIASNTKPPTRYKICQFLGISINTLELWERNEENEKGERIYNEYCEPLKKLHSAMEDWFLNAAYTNPKAQTISIFALKQPKNGGWIDKPTVDISAKELTVNVKGLGENAAD